MKLRKITAVIICTLLLAGSLCVGAYAEEGKKFYLVLGDSIGYGSGLVNSREACYGKIVADTNGYEYANDAIPGHTTRNLLDRLKEDIVIEHVKKADIISITIGGNNFLLGNIFGLLFDGIVKQDYSGIDSIAENFYKDFDKIVSEINALNPDAVILMQTIYNPQTGYIGEVYQQGADRVNAQIVRYAGEHPDKVVIVDIAKALTDSETDFASDRIHPSKVGNEKIAVEILKTLKDLGLGENTEPVINTPGIDITMTGSFTGAVDAVSGLFHFMSLIYNFIRNIFPFIG